MAVPGSAMVVSGPRRITKRVSLPRWLGLGVRESVASREIKFVAGLAECGEIESAGVCGVGGRPAGCARQRDFCSRISRLRRNLFATVMTKCASGEAVVVSRGQLHG